MKAKSKAAPDRDDDFSIKITRALGLPRQEQWPSTDIEKRVPKCLPKMIFNSCAQHGYEKALLAQQPVQAPLSDDDWSK